jgi:carbon storage regulator
MLVLTRKITEGITIGPNIRVIVLEIKGGQVRLGIEAPNSVQVHRDEVYARILDENKQAALTEVRPLPPLPTFNALIKRKT